MTPWDARAGDDVEAMDLSLDMALARRFGEARAGVDPEERARSVAGTLSKELTGDALTVTLLPPPAKVTDWVTGAAPGCWTSNVYGPGARLVIS